MEPLLKPPLRQMTTAGSNATTLTELGSSVSRDDLIDSHLGMINVSSAATLDALDTLIHEQDGSVEDDIVLPPAKRAVSRQEEQKKKKGPITARRKLRTSLVDIYNDPDYNLYFAKLLQAWGDRMWIFAVPILLMELRRDPVPVLFYPALYGFCSGASTILFGPVMGEWVDQVSRLHAAKVVTLCQNGFIGIGGILLGACIYYKNTLSDYQLYLAVALLMVISFASNIFYAATILILEKDWVAVLARRDKSRLAGIIATIRRIELITNVLCPLVMAQLMTLPRKDIAAFVIGLWSCLSLFAEYRATRRTCLLAGDVMLKSTKTKVHKKKPLLRKLCKSCFAIYEGWRIFGKSRVCTAGLAVAFLEATVLIFSGVTNSYAVQQGFSSTTVALLAGGDALTGILGTFVFPVLRRRLSLERIGLTAMVFHFLCGSVCVSSNWLPGSPFDPWFLLRPSGSNPSSTLQFSTTPASILDFAVNSSTFRTSESFASTNFPPVAVARDWTSLIVFSAGLTVGRFAFWMIDLTGSQILLESVREEQRGTICAVHYALKKLLNRSKYVMALGLAWPQTFGFLIIASQLFSLVGYAFFVVYCRKNYALKRQSIFRSSISKLNQKGVDQ
ncbi:Solute carrier family 40 member 1 [Hypsibius exemplaris]|uniref:Solute carrier family 40 member n=1 Tax=Hypsibius exemplaris TaxID=2072580 RepID=A0A9X6NDU4_HYPEX|nr:Solute carrier family 40 member 1 [Hypsibius exemplaris]